MGSACSGESTATIKGNTTKEQDDNARAAAGLPATGSSDTAAGYTTGAGKPDPNNPLGFSVAPPATAPDFASQALKQKRASQQLLLLAGRGRRSAFLGAGYGPGALSQGGTTLGNGS